MGWKPVGFSEIEKFPSQVLAHHYPTVTNFGDMTKYKEWNLNDSIGLLVGGTPCQSFSVAGLRKGLDDPRGNLALTYVGILDKFRPKWCIWENVPGVLSSGGGRDFGSFLGALDELGYGWAYRVLDAQNFGVAQRRRRVFVVGHLGDWKPAAEVLFESESLSGHNQKGRGEKEKITSSIKRGLAYGGSNPECADTVTSKWAKGSGGPSGNECGLFVAHKVYETHPADSRVKEMGETCQTVTSRWGTNGGNVPIAIQGNLIGRDKGGPQGVGVSEGETMYTLTKADVHGVATFVDTYNGTIQGDVSATMTADMAGPTHSGPKVMQPISFDSYNQSVSNVTHTLRVGRGADELPMTITQMAVRRLTPVECERLQGFPDNYTNIPKAADGNRYKALGNSMAVPVMRWIGERINQYEQRGVEKHL
jgi:DNA (cytosine-5)-methyltransferase 1